MNDKKERRRARETNAELQASATRDIARRDLNVYLPERY